MQMSYTIVKDIVKKNSLHEQYSIVLGTVEESPKIKERIQRYRTFGLAKIAIL